MDEKTIEAVNSVSQLLTREIEAAAAELDRELLLRERCYPRWIQDGRLSRVDAEDRFKRLSHANKIVVAVLALRSAGDSKGFPRPGNDPESTNGSTPF